MTTTDLNCIELVELVTDYLEDTLPPAERDRFETHLDGCRGCRIYVEQMRQTVRELGRLTKDAIPAGGREELLQTFRAWKQG